jgi:L-lactate utilization protein LutB
MLIQTKVDSEFTPNPEFAILASDEQIERTVKALEANGIHAVVAENGEEARRIDS